MRSSPFLLEVFGGTEQNGDPQLIPTMTTIVTSDQLRFVNATGFFEGANTYVTPMSTLVLESFKYKFANDLVDIEDPDQPEAEFFETLYADADRISEYFGAELATTFTVFQGQTENLPTSAGLDNTEASRNYRLISDSVARYVLDLEAKGTAGRDADQILQGLAEDWADNDLDGMVDGTTTVDGLTSLHPCSQGF